MTQVSPLKNVHLFIYATRREGSRPACRVMCVCVSPKKKIKIAPGVKKFSRSVALAGKKQNKNKSAGVQRVAPPERGGHGGQTVVKTFKCCCSERPPTPQNKKQGAQNVQEPSQQLS